MNFYEKKYYTVYCRSEDKTFIMCDFWRDDELISVEVVGFHYGEPTKESFRFIGKYKATFED